MVSSSFFFVKSNFKRGELLSSPKPFEMAQAMKFAVIAGRKSFISGRILKTLHGSASTTNKGII